MRFITAGVSALTSYDNVSFVNKYLVKEIFVVVIYRVASHRHHPQLSLRDQLENDWARNGVVLGPDELKSMHRVDDAHPSTVSGSCF